MKSWCDLDLIIYRHCSPHAWSGLETMIRFAYSGDETIVSSIEDLDLLFELYCLADKVGDAVFWIRIKDGRRIRLTDFAGSDLDPSYLHLKTCKQTKC